ncbi:MAG: hypothetical protein ACYC6M_01170, partial [Terriglobales bacterium]
SDSRASERSVETGMGLYSFAVFLVGLGVRGIALGAALTRRGHRKLTTLAAYLGLSMAVDFGLLWTFHAFGFSSPQYKYAYYFGDPLVSIAGFVLLVRLLELCFEHSPMRIPQLRMGAMALFSGIAVLTAYFLLSRPQETLMHLGVELEQNLSFLGMILTVLLWTATNVMRVPGLRFRRVILAFSALYSSNAAVFTVHFLLPGFESWRLLVPLTGLLGAGLLAYTLMTAERAQPESQMATAPVPLQEWA